MPEGEYHSIETPQQAAAVEYTHEVGAKLAIDFPGMAQLYREGMTQAQIAEKIIPEFFKLHPEIAEKSVGVAIRSLMDPVELAEIAKRRWAETLERWIGDRRSEANRQVWRRAQATRTKMYGAPTEAMIKGRGQTPWSQAEKDKLEELLKNSEYINEKGHPDYQQIAMELNGACHNGNGIRNTKSLSNYVHDQTRKRKKTNQA